MTIYSAFCLECGKRIEFAQRGQCTGPLQRHHEYSPSWDTGNTDNPWCPNPGPQPDTIESKQQEFGSL